MQSMNSVSASDLEKEQIARLAALNLMGAFFSILARAFAAIVVSLLPLLVMGAAGIVRVSAVASLLATWQGILLSSTIMVLAYLVRR